MSTWVTHLIIADKVLERIPQLCRHEFCVGNIAPDCNIENENWTKFTPSREITHWMTGDRKDISDSDRFYREYIDKRKIEPDSAEGLKEKSFLLGYYSHLAADAEFTRYIRDDSRIKAAWKRIKNHAELSQLAKGMPETWESIRLLINGRERMKDIYTLESMYLEKHPDSGYLTEIIGLKEFPDYIDYLPSGAIVRKIGIMGYMPQRELGPYPYIAMSKEEYESFISTAAELIASGILKRCAEMSDACNSFANF